MKRGVLIGGGGILALGVVAIAVIFFFLGSIIVTAVETTGSEVTKTKVTLAGADIDLSSGKGTLQGFKMGNPAGFKSARSASCSTSFWTRPWTPIFPTST